MRILIISSSYVPVLGGVQTVSHELAKNLQEMGHAVHVLTNRYPRKLKGSEKIDGVSVTRFLFIEPRWSYLIQGRLDLFLAGLVLYPINYFRIVFFTVFLRPDVVNLHFPDSQIPFVRLLKKFFSFRLVVSIHGHEIERWFLNEKEKEMTLLPSSKTNNSAIRLRKILKESEAVTTCSRYMLKRAVDFEPAITHKAHAIYNGLNIKRFDDKKSYKHKNPYIFSYGRFVAKKGFDLLLKAFSEISENFPKMDLIIAGEGEEKERLIQLKNKLNLDIKVHFYGRANPDEVVHLLNGCHLTVIPSRLEPFGIIGLEAIAAGKPILATRVGGLPEFLEHPGIEFSEPSVEELAKKLEKCLNNISSMAKKAKKTREIAKNYPWRSVAENYLKVFTNGEKS